MVDVAQFVASLLHADSRYDPAKAHEYYERTKELKGRRDGKGLSDNQKKGWAYTKSEVEKERKQAVATAADDNRQAVAELRSKSMQRRDAIREKLRQIMDRITSNSAAEREDISKEVQAKIDQLPPIPKGISKAKAAELATERREAIAKIRGEAGADRAALSTDTKTARATERETGNSEREQVITALKGSLEAARDKYKAAREQITAQYESELDTEFNAIRTNVR